MKKFALLSIITLVLAGVGNGQALTRQDTLRGTLTPERSWWDVLKYNVSVEPDFATKTIRGCNVITFKVLAEGSTMQIDLQQPMQLDTAALDGEVVQFERDGNRFLIHLNNHLRAGTTVSLRLAFSGKPKEARNPPWDGGWIWAHDRKNRPWMSVACEGLGASVWYPCKDHQSDEPDNGASLNITVADTLMAVGNGRLSASPSNAKGKTTYSWTVTNPINNYNLIPYIGK